MSTKSGSIPGFFARHLKHADDQTGGKTLRKKSAKWMFKLALAGGFF
jgi:hypothetical protein